MESLEAVLERRRRDLVEALIHGTNMTIRSAEHFVSVAGTDLIEALEWKDGMTSRDSLSEPSHVREVLSTMEASQIASTLDLSQSEVWPALRAFVPHALQIADRRRRA